MRQEETGERDERPDRFPRTPNLDNPSGDSDWCGMPPSLWLVNALWIGAEGVARERKRPGARSAAELAKLADAALAFKRVRVSQASEQR